MKVTEAIEQLQKVLQEHGNLDVEFTDTDQGGYYIAKHITVDTVQQWVDFGTETQRTVDKLVAVVVG